MGKKKAAKQTRRAKRKTEQADSGSGMPVGGAEVAAAADEVEALLGPDGTAGATAEAAVAEQEPDLETQLAELQDRHLRLVAEFDNYRKRTARQLQEFGIRAQAEVLTRLLDALDDLGRVSHLDATTAQVADVLEGIGLVERKMYKELELLGLKALGAEGDLFDPNEHEAVGTMPTESEEQHNTVAAVLQRGYRLGTVLLRPARVQVFM